MNNKRYVNVSGSILVFIISIIVMISCFILKMFANFIIFTDKRIKLKIKYNRIMDNNKDKIKKIYHKNKKEVIVTDLDVINNLNLFNKSDYYQYFYGKIITRGEDYFNRDLVHLKKIKNGMYFFDVSGTENYNVTISFNKDKSISYMNCDCPFNKEKGKYCKHMVASILKMATDYNIRKLDISIKNKIDIVDNKIDILNNYVKNNKRIIKKYASFDYKKFIDDIDLNLESYKNYQLNNDNELISIYAVLDSYDIVLDNHINSLTEMVDLYNNMKEVTKDELDKYKIALDKKEKYINKSVLFPIPIIYKKHSSIDKITNVAENMIIKNTPSKISSKKEKVLEDDLYFDN